MPRLTLEDTFQIVKFQRARQCRLERLVSFPLLWFGWFSLSFCTFCSYSTQGEWFSVLSVPFVLLKCASEAEHVNLCTTRLLLCFQFLITHRQGQKIPPRMSSKIMFLWRCTVIVFSQKPSFAEGSWVPGRVRAGLKEGPGGCRSCCATTGAESCPQAQGTWTHPGVPLLWDLPQM